MNWSHRCRMAPPILHRARWITSSFWPNAMRTRLGGCLPPTSRRRSPDSCAAASSRPTCARLPAGSWRRHWTSTCTGFTS